LKYQAQIRHINEVRANHAKVQRIINGREAWITSASWGLGVRFYPINKAHSGMLDQTKDGAITLIEKL
jgi:hypothetical protein